MARKLSDSPHRSFRRSYRKDYVRETNVPSLFQHIIITFKTIFSNWKLFIPLLFLAVILNILFVGLMSEEVYTGLQESLDETSAQLYGESLSAFPKAGMLLISSVVTGGLSGATTGASVIFMVIIFLILWLVTIFLLRYRLAGQNIKLRDALYNAMTPLISTFVVFAVAVIQCLPIFLLMIAYSAAVQTELFNMPFYALLFIVFAALMILLSGYLLSSTLIALLAVSAPGLYPMRALVSARELMRGRRTRFVVRIIALVFFLLVFWAVIMIPIILFDLFLKQFEWTQGLALVPFCLSVMACFTIIYATTYLYLYYRWLLDLDHPESIEASADSSTKSQPNKTDTKSSKTSTKSSHKNSTRSTRKTSTKSSHQKSTKRTSRKAKK